jgi:hypothetical protein
MRLSIVLAGALAASAAASVAFAAPISSVSISVSPELQHKATHNYGQRELDRLKKDLQNRIERQVGVADNGDRLEVTILDVQPNRPTPKQIGDRGLSYESISIGGASLDGVRISADGRRTPVSYKRYDTDLVDSYRYRIATWATAYNAIDGFARRVAED